MLEIPQPSLQCPTTHTSPLVTHSSHNIHKPVNKLSLSAQVARKLEPTSITQAIKDPKWRTTMLEEFDVLVQNGTWELVPRESAQNIVGCKVIFRIKRSPDGSVDKYKERFVAKGFHQRPRIDYHDTFSPVVKPTMFGWFSISPLVTDGASVR